jgi:hypothetical protein
MHNIKKITIGKYAFEMPAETVTSWVIFGLAALGFGYFILT